MADVMSISNYLCQIFSNNNKPLRNITLQKMLYLSWIAYYQKHHRLLFENEFRAWKFGPVVEDVYYPYRIFAAMPIYRPLGDSTSLTLDMKIFLDSIYEKYKDVTYSELIELTHDDVWKSIYDDKDRHKEIPFIKIVKNYEKE